MPSTVAASALDLIGNTPLIALDRVHPGPGRILAKAEFMMGLGFAIAKSTNIDQHLHVQGMLAELIQFTEFVRACLRAAEVDAAEQVYRSWVARFVTGEASLDQWQQFVDEYNAAGGARMAEYAATVLQ